MAKKKNINYTEIKNKTKTSDQLVNKTKTKNKGETNISPKSANIKVNKNPIIKKLNKIKLFDDEILEVGTIVSVKDGVAQVKGLKSVTSGEMVFLGYLKIKGMVLSLEQKIVSVVIFGNDTLLKQDDMVFRTFAIMSIALSDTLFGRVIDALGNTIDGGLNIVSSIQKPVDTKAIGIIPRESINEPMQTGIKAIDSITPIGCGQRELIIGDRQTGKTTIAIDTILSQKKYGKMFCIYVAIGQKKSTVAQIYESLKKRSAMKNTVIVSATSSESATLQFLAPYSGCCIGE
jgi:F-type H+-transporting ATPase subunit alpha